MEKIIIVSVIAIIFMQPVFAQEGESKTHITHFEMMSSDGSMTVAVDSSLPSAGSPLLVNLGFFDQDENHVFGMNYDIAIMQNGEIVLSQLGQHAANGIAHHATMPLTTDDQTVIMVVLQGIGKEAPYEGPQGETVEVTVVPEFGIMALLVLFLSVLATISVQRAGLVKIHRRV